MSMPSGLSFTQAAAVPEAFVTAWDAMVLQGGLRAGQTVLVHAVASGVGTAALQLCAMTGARCIGTGRSAAKLERAGAIGRLETVLVDGAAPAFADRVKALTAGRGAELVLDLVGGNWMAETLEATAPQGTVMLVGLVAGASAEVPLRTVLGKRLRVIGTTLRARPLEEKIAVARAFEQLVVPQFSTGLLKPVVEQAVPFSDVAGALERLAANDTFGKTVLTW
jgi:NADPH:quinone reductase-like Zn-dependent oxidoreductase